MNIHKYVKPGITILVSLIGLWIGSSVFTYVTYKGEPQVYVVGVAPGGNYKGLIEVKLRGDSGYKVASASVMLDGKPVIVPGAKSIKAKQFEIPFEVDTKELAQGEHSLQVESIDASYHANKRVETITFLVDNAPLKAAFLQPEYKVDQGHTLHAKIQCNKPVAAASITLFAKKYSCHKQSSDSLTYESFIPVDCEQSPGESTMIVELTDQVGNVVKLSSGVRVNPVKFPRQKGFHVAQEKLDDEKEVSMNNRILSTALDKWLEQSPSKKLWRGAFEMPTIVKRVTTPFGEIRVTPQKGRYHHAAIDIANTPKSVVWASQNGKVIIKDRYLMSGNTVVIDHGLGVFTKYYHLEDFADIEVGESIKKGQPVGRLGMTGFATGYHLHWELSVQGISVDPVEWTKKVF